VNEPKLARVLGVPGAIALGLGSIVGTGVYVSLAIATGATGAALVPAILLAGLVALANALASAALATIHPVSGGTYEYGRRYLGEAWGFTAGALFLVAKSASAATAALGVSHYFLDALGLSVSARWVAPAIVLAITALVASGLKRSNLGNAVAIALGLGALILLVGFGLWTRASDYVAAVRLDAPSWRGFFEGTALVFVAFTGYGRVATLGEEVRDPARTIPRAIVATLCVSVLTYGLVGATALVALGAEGFAATTRSDAPLSTVATALGSPWIARALVVGAGAAMIGVLLNLVLGLSRVLFAMARRGDAPGALAVLRDSEPRRAVWTIGLVIASATALGDVRTTWSLSAFTVLVYYGITQLAALRLPKGSRPSVLVLGFGVIGCFGLAFVVDPRVLAVGTAAIATALLARTWIRRTLG